MKSIPLKQSIINDFTPRQSISSREHHEDLHKDEYKSNSKVTFKIEIKHSFRK